ncbi:unnamed protein product, partial [Ixodes persulcatus]
GVVFSTNSSLLGSRQPRRGLERLEEELHDLLTCNKYHKEDDETRIALLLHVGGAELVQKYHAFTFPAAQQKFADVLQRFDEHFERY